MALDFSSNLDDPQAATGRNITAPLDELGIDPDEAMLNRAATMARVNQSPLQRLQQEYQKAAVTAPSISPTPVATPKPTATPAPVSSFGGAPRPPASSAPSAPPALPSANAPRPTATPAPQTAVSVAPTGTTSASPSVNPGQSLTDYGTSGLQALQDNLKSATDAVNQIPTTDTASESLEAQLAKDTAARPQAYDPTTGKLNAQYKPSAGQRIVRGLEGAGLGLATGGFRGAIGGAIKPELVGVAGYGAPTAQYGRDVAQNAQTVASDTQQVSQAQQRWKDMVDAQKARATEYRANAGLGKDLVSGSKDLQTAATAAANIPIEQQKANNESPAAKIQVEQAKLPQTYEELVRASLTDPSPMKRQQYQQAAKQIRDTEIKKFQSENPGNGQPTVGGGSGPSGADYMQTLPPGVRGQVQAIGEGRMAPPSSRSKQGMALLNAVAQAYPGFDATQYPTYQKTRQAFTSGTIGVAINSFSTALKHLDALESHLPNNTSIPALNWLKNTGQKASGSGALKPYEADAVAVSNEIAKAYKGGAISKEEHEEMMHLLSENDSPAAMHANIGEFRNLLGGKLQSYQQQWEAAMPKGAVSPLETLAQQQQEVNPSSGGANHQIQVDGKTYEYKGTGPTEDMNSYKEVKK